MSLDFYKPLEDFTKVEGNSYKYTDSCSVNGTNAKAVCFEYEGHDFSLVGSPDFVKTVDGKRCFIYLIYMSGKEKPFYLCLGESQYEPSTFVYRVLRLLHSLILDDAKSDISESSVHDDSVVPNEPEPTPATEALFEEFKRFIDDAGETDDLKSIYEEFVDSFDEAPLSKIISQLKYEELFGLPVLNLGQGQPYKTYLKFLAGNSEDFNFKKALKDLVDNVPEDIAAFKIPHFKKSVAAIVPTDGIEKIPFSSVGGDLELLRIIQEVSDQYIEPHDIIRLNVHETFASCNYDRPSTVQGLSREEVKDYEKAFNTQLQTEIIPQLRKLVKFFDAKVEEILKKYGFTKAK